jgi:virulence factor Mce-like protein
MRRIALISMALVAAAAFAVASAGAGNDPTSSQAFTVELDNAFGIVTGADLKIAGVRAGRITDLRLDRRTRHALVDFEITKLGFGSLRSDVFCETRPQSLIGEYFIDCSPGTSSEKLKPGALIPVSRTASTVPGDLVNNIMRRPERERLRIILNEIGAGLGARGDELNDAIRRASPALRETDKVLNILARQNQVLKNLVTNADTVITDLAGNKKDVARWVKETHETAAASAERSADIAGNFQRLPQFLRELRPTMAELGRVADAQTPTLVDLQASAGGLQRLFDQLEPFAKASQANLGALGDAARIGRPAVKAALPLIEEVDRFAAKAPEAAKNARIITADLDDRGRAVEKDPRSPGGQGYTGFEAILQYIFDQTMSINIYDSNSYLLKANLFHSECSDFQSATSLKAKLASDSDFYKRCASILGPNQQGITTPDPTLTQTTAKAKKHRKAKKKKKGSAPAAGEAPAATDEAVPEAAKPPIDLGDTLDDLLQGKLPDVVGNLDLGKPLGGLNGRDSSAANSALLDFLFGT